MPCAPPSCVVTSPEGRAGADRHRHPARREHDPGSGGDADLASEGLITLDSHRIGTVRMPDWDEMEIVEMRRSLESLAIHRAMAQITAEELKDAEQVATQLSEEEDLGSWVQTNILFHSIFHKATRSRRLSGVLLALEEAGGVFVAQAQQLHPEIRRKAIADHFALLDALRDERGRSGHRDPARSYQPAPRGFRARRRPPQLRAHQQ